MFKISAVALALTVAFSANAMTSIEDADLSQVTGQDGVTIGGDLNINIGAFTWGDDVGAGGGTVSFNNISIKGLFVQTIDVINAETIVPLIIKTMRQYVSSPKSISEANKLITETFDVFGASLGPDSAIYDGASDGPSSFRVETNGDNRWWS